MSKLEKTKAVPRLRFPEFMGSGEWVETFLQEQVHYENGKAHENEIDLQGQYVVVNSKFISTDGEIKKFTNKAYCLAHKNDILMVLSDVPNGKAIAKCFHVDEDKKYTVNQRICRLTSVNDNSVFLFFIINRNAYFLSFDDGVKQTNLRKENVLNCPLVVPKKLEEQQKIADCLTSLDEKINAQNAKIESLKAHKKGLMQKLFPTDGADVPTLRFPEFAESGEWERVLFSKYIKLFRGSSPRPISEFLTTSECGVNWIKIGDTKLAQNHIIKFVDERITSDGAKKSRQVYKGELILANSMSYGKTYELALDGCIYDGWFVLREYEDFFHKPFLLQLLNSDIIQAQYEKLSAGGIVQNISSDIVYNVKLFHMVIEEQQKIADCLTSLDELITAHILKLELLKEHKKGLMQKLFPQ